MDVARERHVLSAGRYPTHGLLILLGGLTVVGGGFGPWLRVASDFNFPHSTGGIETLNGKLTLVLAAILILAGLTISVRRAPPDDLFYRPLGAGTVLLAILLVEPLISYASITRKVGGPLENGWGLALCWLGGAACLMGGALTFYRGHKSWRVSQSAIGTPTGSETPEVSVP